MQFTYFPFSDNFNHSKPLTLPLIFPDYSAYPGKSLKASVQNKNFAQKGLQQIIENLSIFNKPGNFLYFFFWLKGVVRQHGYFPLKSARHLPSQNNDQEKFQPSHQCNPASCRLLLSVYNYLCIGISITPQNFNLKYLAEWISFVK